MRWELGSSYIEVVEGVSVDLCGAPVKFIESSVPWPQLPVEFRAQARSSDQSATAGLLGCVARWAAWKGYRLAV